MKNNKKATKNAKKAAHAARKSPVRRAPKAKRAPGKAVAPRARIIKAIKKAARTSRPADGIKAPAEKKEKAAPDFRFMNMADEALIESVIGDDHFNNHISRSVGKRAREIIQLLATPQTDDAIAEKLEIKINEVRRMLNTLNTFGVTRYNVNKDSKGWLTFKWYIDANKLTELKNDIMVRSVDAGYKIPEGCNDFFICNKCYVEQKTIFPFETAFEMSFKCDCGSTMKQVNKMEVEQLIVQEGKIM
ncbi:MAG: hypothetical protein KGH59_00985 [Candidatus Micrarchaeota archaeon]|nr:hypothetical protein [Candidatus Micrarchaeota archaeon]MDE1804344.1 hypothetical protein [Candidatus Micrarchaeota archaeon]MDE1846551.1 hypothetical protein [Candidatus Micrarchaeota archaeon]